MGLKPILVVHQHFSSQMIVHQKQLFAVIKNGEDVMCNGYMFVYKL